MYKQMLGLMQGCFNDILVTGDGSAGACQEYVSKYTCDLIYKAISCASQGSSFGTSSRVEGGIFGFGKYMADSVRDVQTGIKRRYGSTNMFNVMFVDKKDGKYSIQYHKKRAIDTVKEKYEKGVSLGRLREENPKLAEKVEKERSEGQLQYARSGNKWCVLKLKKTISGEPKYKNALAAVRDLYHPEIKMAELRKENPSLLSQLKREGNLSEIPYTNKGYKS